MSSLTKKRSPHEMADSLLLQSRRVLILTLSHSQKQCVLSFTNSTIVNCFGLMQVVDSPTRSESILDLTLTDTFESITVLLYWPISLGSSDHRIINFTFITKVAHPLQPSKVVFYYKNPNWNSFCTELTSATWDSVFANNNINDISGTDGNVFSTKPFATTSLQREFNLWKMFPG